MYLVAAVNASNDPTVVLTAITFTIGCIVTVRQFIGSRMYRKWSVDILETFFFLNILLLAIFTSYCLNDPNSNQEAAAYTSVIISFIVLLFIILYHVYMYTTVFSKFNVKTATFGKMIDRLFTDADPKPKPERSWGPLPDDDIHRFNELLDTIDHTISTNDYEVSLEQNPVKPPTQSVVEMCQLQLAPPDPKEVTNIQCISVATEATV